MAFDSDAFERAIEAKALARPDLATLLTVANGAVIALMALGAALLVREWRRGRPEGPPPGPPPPCWGIPTALLMLLLVVPLNIAVKLATDLLFPAPRDAFHEWIIPGTLAGPVVALAALLLARRSGRRAGGVGLGAAAAGRSSLGTGVASFAMAFPLYHAVHAATGMLFEAARWPKTPNLAAERVLLSDAPLEVWWIAAFAVIVAPVCEEIVFRGIVFPALRLRLGFHGAALATGVLFALLHPPIDWAALVILAYFLARAYERSGSLRAAIIAHSANNALGIGLLLIQRHIHRA